MIQAIFIVGILTSLGGGLGFLNGDNWWKLAISVAVGCIGVAIMVGAIWMHKEGWA